MAPERTQLTEGVFRNTRSRTKPPSQSSDQTLESTPSNTHIPGMRAAPTPKAPSAQSQRMKQPKSVADSQMCPGLNPPNKLCRTCDKLHLQAMLSAEKKEKLIGFLSNYIDLNCPFCHLISESISRAWGDSALDLDLTTTRLFIQSKSSLYMEKGKKKPTTEFPLRLLLATDAKPQDLQVRRATLRAQDKKTKIRFIIAEIESLPDDSTLSVSKETDFFPRREVGNHVNIQLVKHWLEECQKHKHSKPKGNDIFQHEHPFRLIDVIDECLVEKTERCDYVALSYVWGSLPTLCFPGEDTKAIPILLTMKKNIESLSVPKSLSPLQPISRESGEISHTTSDAMALTRKIGMRYLWVDTLCIVQDDKDGDEKRRLISRMDDIYNNANFTIIAAAGKDAHAGLSGIRHRIGHPIKLTKIFNASDGTILNLSVCLPSLCTEVRREMWNTRGWTFQEQCLSQRCLYFTAEETFFDCIKDQWREGYDYGEGKHSNFDISIRKGPPWWGRDMKVDHDPSPHYYFEDTTKELGMQDYQKAVQDYSRTVLTDPKDVLKAFQGIFNRFQKSRELNTCQNQGIPTHFLFQALLWFPADKSEKRLCNLSKPGEPTKQFSTWSWASWNGVIEFVFADNLWLSSTTSLTLREHVPMYVPITCWYYGESSNKFWSCSTWEDICEAQNISNKSSDTRNYLSECIGIDIDLLLSQSLERVPPDLKLGELGFFGSYLSSKKFCLSALTSKELKKLKGSSLRVSALTVAAHGGQFRFDSEGKELDELVVIVTGQTYTTQPKAKPKPKAHAMVLGLTTQDGISTRVGVGEIKYNEDLSLLKPQWEYKFFKLR